MRTQKTFIFNAFASLFGFYGVAAGAVAAHGVADPTAAGHVTTASLYALLHAAVLLAWHGKFDCLIKGLFMLGVSLFSGSLTLTYLCGMHGFEKLAPIGGTTLLVAWLLLFISAVYSAVKKA